MVNKSSVAVLMASYNGIEWIDTQITSILAQRDVEVTVYVSDDASNDDTNNCLIDLSRHEKRLYVLSGKERLGSAGKNFYRLIQEVDFGSFDYVAFSDQDDIWQPDKLIRHIGLAKSKNADGVSSDVIAFWPNGKQKNIRKSQPQKKWDFLFESAGPGCTFLMTPWLVGKVREQLVDENSPAKEVALHDWLTYAVCRAYGRKWVIDATPSLQYRQHQHNVLGANTGFRAAMARINKLKSGWYLAEISKVARVCWQISNNEDVKKIAELAENNCFYSRIRLLKYIPEARRKFLDRIALTCLILIF